MPQDSSSAQFWEQRYRTGVTPWDAGGVPSALAAWAWLASHRQRMRVLIPGCGRGYEARYFAELGHEVVAIDFSDAAIEETLARLRGLTASVSKADFFTLADSGFDLIYERTFLCALPRRLWPQWAGRMAELVRPAGLIAGFFFFDDNPRGPPFGASKEELDLLLGAHFARIEDRAVPCEESVAVLAGRERWQVWRRQL